MTKELLTLLLSLPGSKTKTGHMVWDSQKKELSKLNVLEKMGLAKKLTETETKRYNKRNPYIYGMTSKWIRTQEGDDLIDALVQVAKDKYPETQSKDNILFKIDQGLYEKKLAEFQEDVLALTQKTETDFTDLMLKHSNKKGKARLRAVINEINEFL